MQLDRTSIPKKTVVTISDLGMLSTTRWSGKVSATQMVTSGQTTHQAIADAVKCINDYYVDVQPSSKTRCIDGRSDPRANETNLGAQVPGGAPGAALAYRLGVDEDDLTRGTFLSDAQAMIDTFVRLGFMPGGHRDENSSGNRQAVGCGAIDSMDAILTVMIDPRLVEDHKRIVKQLLGSSFNRDDYLRVMGAAVVVNGGATDYFRDRKKIIDWLELKAPGSIATLSGEHQECIVSVNMVPQTTLASNRFAAENRGIQAFGYDLWRSMEMAERLLPRTDQRLARQRFVMARVMCTVATLMSLTDGTQRLVLRTLTEVDKPTVE